MNRGDIYTAILPGSYGKPRPIVILQADSFNGVYSSVVIMPFTTCHATVARVMVEPSLHNGLAVPSYLMTNHITTIVKDKIGSFVGRLEDEYMVAVNNRLINLLGLRSLIQ